MNIHYNKSFNLNQISSISLFPVQDKFLKVGKIALVSLGIFMSLIYLKIKLDGWLSNRKVRLLNDPISSFSPQTLNLENAHQLKECSLKSIQTFLKQPQQGDYVHFKSLYVPTTLLRQLFQKKLPLDEKSLFSLYTLENSKGEKYQLTGFEKALLMQHSLPFYNLWTEKNHKKMSLIKDSHDFDMLKILLQSLYDPKILEEKEREICSLASASFKFQLNEEKVNKNLENLLLASFEKNETHNIEVLLRFFKSYQKPLTPSIQQALQRWLNGSIGTSAFSSYILILKNSSVDSLDFSNTSISNQELSYLNELSLFKLILKNCPITDEGLKHLKGLAQLQELDLNHCDKLIDQDLQHLKSLNQLKKLKLSRCFNITDQGVEHLKDLKQLQKLNLSRCYKITNRSLEHLKGLTQLEKIDLGRCTKITDQGLEHLKGLTQLKKLDLGKCNEITDQGLEHLKNLVELTELDLTLCENITDQGLEHLKGLKQLQKLSLNVCKQITDQGLKHLKGLKQLTELNLVWCNQLLDYELSELKDLTQLKKLNLTMCLNIADEGLKHLKKLTQLQKLNLAGCYQIIGKGLEYLKGLNQLQKLNLERCDGITDQSLEHLKDLKQLQKLNLAGCSQITTKGITYLYTFSQLKYLSLSSNQVSSQVLNNFKNRGITVIIIP